MSATAAAAFFRGEEQRIMDSECVIVWEDPDGPGRYDPTTMTYTPQPATLYTGPCQLRPGGTQGSTDEQGDGEVRSFGYVLKIPYDADAAPIPIGAVATITSSPDPAASAAARDFRIVDVPANDFVVNRRFPVEEVRPVVRPS